jgi:periplasmic divalent cation tolerance protein
LPEARGLAFVQRRIQTGHTITRRIEFANGEVVSAIVILCTCPDEAVAERIATTLVEERLAACVNRVPGIVSTYRWNGKICNDREVLLLIKTMIGRFDSVRECIVALHPYDVPEVVALTVSDGLAAYVDWIESSVRVDERGS